MPAAGELSAAVAGGLFTANRRLASLARSGQISDAFLLFKQMLENPGDLVPDQYSICPLIRCCSNNSISIAGEQLHALAFKSSLSFNPFVAAELVNLYTKTDRIHNAHQVFDEMPDKERSNRVLFTSVIVGKVKIFDFYGALECFKRMRAEGLVPNKFTIPSVLAACAAEQALKVGAQVHACAVRIGLLRSSFVRSALVNMYGNCLQVDTAKKLLLLDTADLDDVDDELVSWNALIVRSSRTGFHGDALSLFVQMQRRGLKADEFTYPSVLNSAGLVDNFDFGWVIHGLITRTGLLVQVHVGNALVDMYSKCGRMDDARTVFYEMPLQDVVGWTAMLTGLAQHELYDDALSLFCEMCSVGVNVDEYVVASILSCCAELTLLELGRQVHSTSLRYCFDSFNSVRNSLVSLYAKTGCIDEAQVLFDSMEYRDAITWTALIVGYAQNGRGCDAVQLYEKMVQCGIKPDYITFIGLLFACSHAGLVNAGKAYFDSMDKTYGVIPGPDHYACMIDLLGRAGKVQEAAKWVNQMPTKPDKTIWKTLLAACRVHGDVSIAEFAAEALFKLDPTDASGYVLLSNMYSSSRRWSDMAKIRSFIKSGVGKKEPGCSWMEVDGQMHLFHVEDVGHPRTAEVYSKLEEMIQRIREAGYVPETEYALHDVGEEGREAGLRYHSEKLATAYGLLSLSQGADIRVFKNIRVCGDCHTALKLVTKVYGRKIVLRDANCFHHMSSGVCSCGDYW